MSNLSSNKKYHYLYKTVNKINGKFYFGVHSTNDLEDGYLGSGTTLRAAFRKHGKENFELTVLEYFDSRESLLVAERDLISEELIKSSNCYNLKPGGRGGFTVEQARKGGKLSGTLHAQRLKDDLLYREQVVSNLRRASTDRYLNSKESFSIVKHRYDWKGKKHTPETIEKMKQAHRGQSKGVKNSQFGTVWITNGIESKKISKDEAVPTGWGKGRVLKQKQKAGLV